jgi:hypothetical protein
MASHRSAHKKPRESSDDDDFPAVIKPKPSSPRKEMTCQERTDAFMEEIRKLRWEMKEGQDRANRRIASLEADRDRKNALRRLRQFFQENSAGRGRLRDGAVRRFHDSFKSEVNVGHFHAPHELSSCEELAATVAACRAFYPLLPSLKSDEIAEMWSTFNGAGSL